MDPKLATFRNRVIVLDDDADTREVFAQFCRGTWSRVDEFESGEEALKSMDRDTPTVVLMDINLSTGINGYEAARRIRALPAPGRVWLIAMTGHSKAQVTEKGDLFDAIFTKPVDPDELIATMKRLVS